MTYRTLTLTETVFPARSLAREAALIGGAVALTAAAARVVIPLPFAPVPITGQTFAVLLSGAALGSWRGLAAMLLYLVLGGMGLPIFSRGTAGLSAGAGGYLVGFVGAAWLVGRLCERGWDRRPLSCALAMAAGSAVLYACALPWLVVFLGMSSLHAVAVGLLPFLPGDALKIALAAGLLPGAWRVLSRL